MVFWLGILAGVVFAWFAINKGFYETWATLFNILIAVYLAVFLTPLIKNAIPGTGDTTYGDALTMLMTAMAVFVILHGVTYVFLLSQFKIDFPKIFEAVGSGLLGFLGGLFIWGFIVLMICASPLSKNKFFQSIGFSGQPQQTNFAYISWWMNLVDSLVSAEQNEQTAEKAISNFMEKRPVIKPPRAPEPSEPAGPVEPNETKQNVIERIELGPPPEPDFDDI